MTDRAPPGGRWRRTRPRDIARRFVPPAWLLLQSTIAATAAWFVAREVIGHAEPFFAPIAAVVALNASVGQRGLNAVRLVLGVAVGIVAGEVTLGLFGSGTVALALGTLAAMAVARTLGGARVMIAQAASGAILTVATGEHIGFERLVDAFVGAGIALAFTQVLFSPEPVALLRRVEAAALKEMAAVLDLTARALDGDDPAQDDRAMERQRELRARLVDLGQMRSASQRTASHSALWRSRRKPLVREREDAGHLAHLGDSVLLLTRIALATEPAERRRLAPSVRQFAATVTDLAATPGDRSVRQAAAERALAAVDDIAPTIVEPAAPWAVAVASLYTAIIDLMVFAGVDPQEALAAVRAGSRPPEVTDPPSTPRIPFGWLRRLLTWLPGRLRRLRGSLRRLPKWLRRVCR